MVWQSTLQRTEAHRLPDSVPTSPGGYSENIRTFLDVPAVQCLPVRECGVLQFPACTTNKTFLMGCHWHVGLRNQLFPAHVSWSCFWTVSYLARWDSHRSWGSAWRKQWLDSSPAWSQISLTKDRRISVRSWTASGGKAVRIRSRYQQLIGERINCF